MNCPEEFQWGFCVGASGRFILGVECRLVPVQKMKGRDIEWTTGCLSSSLTIHYDLGFVHPLHNSVAAQSNLLLSINILLKHHTKKERKRTRERRRGCR